MKVRFFISLFVLAFTLPAFAQIQITDIQGEPKSNLANASGSTPIIWAGLAGPECAGTTLCNNCDTADRACNLRRINQDGILRIEFKVTGDISGPIRFGHVNGASFQTITPATLSPAGTLSKNSTGSVEVEWGELCEELGDGTCNGDGLRPPLSANLLKLKIGVSTSADPGSQSQQIDTYLHLPTASGSIDILDCTDSNSAGICRFHAYPGDQKIYVRDIDPGNTAYPESNNVRLQALRIFISENNFAEANYNAGSYVDLTIPEDGEEPEPGIVDGLQNGVTYFFRPAVIDNAYNVAFLADEAQIIDVDPDIGAGPNCGAGTDDGCDMIAEPLPVYGLLTEDYNCFISTAAFGSPLSSEVQTFREFRNRYMIHYPLGIQFRNFYYEHGPKAARWLANNSWAKPMARASLYPALWFSKLSLRFGIVRATVISSFALLSVFAALFFSLWSVRQWRLERS